MNAPESRSGFLANPWTYVAATFLWTWSLCAVLALNDLSANPALSGTLLLGAMIGPGVTGIVFMRLTRDAAARRDFWRRVFDVRRLTWPWIGVTVAIPFTLQLGAGALDALFGGGPSWGEAAGEFLASPVQQILTLWIITLVPFFEEIGWRGYLQDRFMERFDAVRASLVLGVVWSVWHVPAFFVPGTYHAAMGFLTLESLLFFVGIVALSVVVSWIYLNTGRSIVIMVLFHATVNLSGELIALTRNGETLFTLAWFVLAAAIVLVCGRTMRVPPLRSALRAGTTTALIAVACLAASDAAATSRLQAVVDSVRTAHDLPGLSAAYARADGSIESAASGLADVERGVPMRVDTPMLAASIGKTFVGATAASLADEGLVDLDAPISRWLAGRVWFERLPNHDTITLRHLLDHASGLPDHVHDERFVRSFGREWDDPDADLSAERWIGFVLDREPLFPAGQGFAYTDTGFLLAGLVLEAATEHTLSESIGARFLDPLRLASTLPSDRPDLPGLACGYVAPDGPIALPRRTVL